ncbi:hypothetical protein LCGC14_1910320, partial [marine sediment metagenome]
KSGNHIGYRNELYLNKELENKVEQLSA